MNRAYLMTSNSSHSIRLSDGPSDLTSNVALTLQPDNVRRSHNPSVKVPFKRSKSMYKGLPQQMTTYDGRYQIASEWQQLPTSKKGTLVPSYPFSYQRLNLDQKLVKYQMGYMNDSSYRNASDPNSLIDQGITRNAVYNVRLN